jgi:hypothetical protein
MGGDDMGRTDWGELFGWIVRLFVIWAAVVVLLLVAVLIKVIAF